LAAQPGNCLSKSVRQYGLHASSTTWFAWRREPPDQATVEGCAAIGSDNFLPLPELVERFGDLAATSSKWSS
jgi:hypothetical protein